MRIYVAAFGFGLVTAAVLAISAVGFTLQAAIAGVINLSYGSVMIACAFVAYTLNVHGVHIWIAALAAAVSGSILSVLLNRAVFAPFQRQGASRVAMMIVTLAVGLVVGNAVLAVTGPDNVSYAMSYGESVRWGALVLTTSQLWIMGLAVVLMTSLHVLLRFTKLGKAMRATAANQTLARNSGIRTRRVIDVTWALTGALCGLAGTVFAIDSASFGPSSAGLFLVVILAAAVFGGIGRPYGAMAGAVVLGIVTEVSAALIAPDYKEIVAFMILLVLMAVRPQGVFARAQ